CWLWTGSGRGNGYGAIKVDGVVVNTHVLAWRIANSGAPIPEGRVIMHTCDVRLCVRPEHLVLGTYSDNLHDANRKGRLSWSVGERSPFSVLTEDLVRQIRKLSEEGVGYVSIAKKIGVSKWAVRQVV